MEHYLDILFIYGTLFLVCFVAFLVTIGCLRYVKMPIKILFTYLKPFLKTFSILILVLMVADLNLRYFFPDVFLDANKFGITLVFFILLVMFLNNVINDYYGWYSDKLRLKKDFFRVTQLNALKHLVKVVAFFLVVIGGMEYLNLPSTGIIALAGTGGLAGAFAAKDLAKNILGGVVIFFDQPFKVGDYLSSPDKDILGEVIHIDWRVTEILRPSGVTAYIPNGEFVSIIVHNLSNRKKAKFKESIGIAYDDFVHMPKIINEIREYLNSCEFIESGSAIDVNLSNFGSSSLDILVSCFIKTSSYSDWLRLKGIVLTKIYSIITENGAQVPFTTLSIVQDPAEE